jgi:hypothetical protein
MGAGQVLPVTSNTADSGKLEIRQTNIGDIDEDAPIAVYYGGRLPFPEYESFVLDHCDISTNLSPLEVFPGNWPTGVRDSFIRQRGHPAVPIGNRASYLQGSGNALHVPWEAYKTQYVQIDGDTQFIFDNPVEGPGSNMRMILRANYAQGPFNVTWPNNVVWDTGGPPNIPNNGVPIIIELSYTNDSTNLMGPVILGRVATQRSDQFVATLKNNANGNVVRKSNSRFLKIIGPTAPFTISGFDPAPDGFVLEVYNASGQQMTIKNQDSNGGTVLLSHQIQTLRVAAHAQPEVRASARPHAESFSEHRRGF